LLLFSSRHSQLLQSLLLHLSILFLNSLSDSNLGHHYLVVKHLMFPCELQLKQHWSSFKRQVIDLHALIHKESSMAM